MCNKMAGDNAWKFNHNYHLMFKNFRAKHFHSTLHHIFATCGICTFVTEVPLWIYVNNIRWGSLASCSTKLQDISVWTPSSAVVGVQTEINCHFVKVCATKCSRTSFSAMCTFGNLWQWSPITSDELKIKSLNGHDEGKLTSCVSYHPISYGSSDVSSKGATKHKGQ